jgi:Periplasmic sensor domain
MKRDPARIALHPFRDIPIRQKLVIIIMVTTTAALLLASLGIVLADSLLFRGYLRLDLSALTRIIADNSTASLAFNDPKSASETLAALRARTHVVGACIYRLDATILASYSRQNNFVCPPVETESAIRFTRDQSTAAAPDGKSRPFHLAATSSSSVTKMRQAYPTPRRSRP